tara:strand:- start:1850 stop:2083 length:234 start_codon:yes stop_codon:yes gene_type:complete
MPKDVNESSSDYQFGKIVTKLESIEITMSDQHTEIMARMITHEKRINGLEKWRAWSTGAFAVITGVAGTFFAWFHSK